MHRRSGNKQSGFTYIETLIAVAILAVALTAIYQSYATGMRVQQSVERRGLALLQAQSLMARIGYEYPLAKGEKLISLGDGFSAKIAIAKRSDERPAGTGKNPMSLYAVDVTVSWQEPRSGEVDLTTLKAAVRD